MSAVSLPAPTAAVSRARITASGLLRSEWTKLWSVRSLRLTLAFAFALVIGLSSYLIIEGTTLGGAPADIPFSFTAVYPVGMLALVVLGVLTVTSEYSSGTIRSSLVAVPKRSGVLLAKAAVLTAVTAVLGAFTSVLLYVLVQVTGTLPSANGMSLFDPDMFWGVLAGTLVLPYGALFGIALGALIRNAAAAITLYFAVFQMGPQIFPVFLPEGLARVTDYMPFAAMDVVRAAGAATEPYGVGIAIVVLTAWIVVIGGSAWWLLKRCDV